MPFAKGNTLAKKNIGRTNTKTQAWNNIVGWRVGDGGGQFKELVAAQATGKEVKPSQREFIKTYMSLLEYHQPKLARTEHTGKDGAELMGTTVYLPARPREVIDVKEVEPKRID